MDLRLRVVRASPIGIIAIGLVACGDEGGTPTNVVQATTVGNRAPIISGSPSASVLVGSTYRFVPAVSDADGDPLSFSVTGLPSWASIDSGSGALTGSPTVGDVGTYANVSIIVGDGTASSTLGPFSIQVVSVALGTATLNWTPPTANTDGSTLTDLAGYILYWGTASGTYANSVTLSNAGLASYVVDNLLSGTIYFFAITAFNSDGMESSFSNEVGMFIP